MKKLRSVILGGILLVVMLGLTACGKTTVDLNKYMTITAQGYDSMGTVSYEFDYDAFEDDYSEKIKISGKKKSEADELGLLSELDPAEVMLDFCVTKKLDKTAGLSNGDKVTLKWDCDEEMAEEYFNVKLKYSDIEYKVSGLEEVSKFNPFDYVTISFSGIAPNGKVVITQDYNRPEMQYILVTADRANGLKTGDTITLTAQVSGNTTTFMEKFGSVLAQTEKTYTVEGLAKYVSDMSEIPSDIYDKMHMQLKDSYYATAASWSTAEVKAFENIGNYLVKLKEGMYGNPNNYLYYVYRATINIDDVDFTYYWYGYFTDIMMLADGTCSVDLSKYTVSKASSSWGFHSGDYLSCYDGKYYVAGFADLETFINQHIVSKIANYEYTQTVDK
ncbi:MAG: hypothetical protein IKL04_01870 [Lachnospiraceae bacterium]|nr:hypothetical protein [Lachnospiraceae bacterium]